MWQNLEIGMAGRRAAAALAVVLAAWVSGCESTSNLSEYEKLVARRRAAPEAPRPEVQVQPVVQQPAAAPASAQPVVQTPSPATQKQAPAAQKPKPAPSQPTKKPAVQPKPAPQAKPAPKPAPAPVEEPVAVVVPPPAPVETPVAVSVPQPAPVETPVVVAMPEPAPVVETPVVVVEPPAPVVEPPPPPAVEPAPALAPVQVSPSGRSSVQGVYTLKKGDIVQVVLRGIPEQGMIDDSLDEFGMISLPFLNEVYAEGFTASELEQRIRQLYRDSQIYPNVTVQVQVPTRFYYMQGEIRGPGRVQLVSATRLSQAIAAAGGGTEFWNGKVQLRRDGEIYRKIKDARRLEKYPEDDIFLEPGDIVELMRSWF